MILRKRFYETERMFRRRLDVEAALASLGEKKLWRIYAIEMIPQTDNSWRMGKQDHFTVEACSEEMAIGVFKYRTVGKMNWFVTRVEEETISA